MTCRTLVPSDLKGLRGKHVQQAEACLTARELVAQQGSQDMMNLPLTKLDVHVVLVLCNPKATHHKTIAGCCKESLLPATRAMYIGLIRSSITSAAFSMTTCSLAL